jgi:hypothetical protein
VKKRGAHEKERSMEERKEHREKGRTVGKKRGA